MAIAAFALICLLSLQMSMVLPPLHWAPTPGSLISAPGVPMISTNKDIALRKRVDEIEAVLLGMQMTASRDLHSHEERLLRLELAQGFVDTTGGASILGRIA